MATPKRVFPSDHIQHVNNQSIPGGNKYSASLQADGTLQTTKNGVVLHRRVFPAPHDAAHNDTNPNGDAVFVVGNDGITSVVDFAQLLNTLK
jgi:hypothetical protein